MSSSSPPSPDSYINHNASIQYWTSVSPNVNGMLGGFPQISRIDLRGSANFLSKVRRLLRSDNPDNDDNHDVSKPLKRGVDCGAGIGRVTNGFLSNVCEVVDAVEPVEKFAAKLRESQGSAEEEGKKKGKLGHLYVVGLENWVPWSDDHAEGADTSVGSEDEEGRAYDIIWNQWCLGHLTDRQLVDYLRRCKRFLSSNGFIVIKENVSTDSGGQDIYDEVDSSVTRTDAKIRSLIKDAGLNLIKSEEQLGFPKSLGLFPVRFYALRPTSV